MILSVSRRTDIPAYYSDWFWGRLRAGYLYTVNPYNASQRKRIELSPGEVDGMVFWTKNPAPMLAKLDLLERYAYYFTVTLNGYGPDIEPGFGGRFPAIADAVKRIAARTGPRRVRWRYNPILLGGGYTPEWHAENFARVAKALDGAAQKCVLSFYDSYTHTGRAEAAMGFRAPAGEERRETLGLLAAEARRAGVVLVGCGELAEGDACGIQNAPCIDTALLSEIAGRPITARRDPNQRKGCLCAASVDVGAYNTCPGGCAYCYARRSEKATQQRYKSFDPAADCMA